MHSFILIVGVVLLGTENYHEWSRKIKHTLIFNELCRGVCEGEGDNAPTKPNSYKEITIWENKHRNSHALIATSINKELNCHISPLSNSFEALQKLRELYESHFELEVFQLMIKLFKLELKNDDPLALQLELISIIHDIKIIGIEIDIPLIAYVKSLYPTYSNYRESLQVSGNLKKITFNSLEKKFFNRGRILGRRKLLSIINNLCILHIERRIVHKILLEKEVS